MMATRDEQDEQQVYLDEMRRRRGYVLPYHRALAEHDLPMLKKANELIEAAYLDQRLLDRRTKELIFVASLTVLRSATGHIQSHIRAALAAGASPQEVLEAIELTLPEAGVVVFQHGFEAWYAVVGAPPTQPTAPGDAAGERE